jgi:hypothetical protein
MREIIQDFLDILLPHRYYKRVAKHQDEIIKCQEEIIENLDRQIELHKEATLIRDNLICFYKLDINILEEELEESKTL